MFFNNNQEILEEMLESQQEQINRLRHQISRLNGVLFVNDFFTCQGDSSIIKSEAVSFEKLEHVVCSTTLLQSWSTLKEIKTYYTTKENYENHKPLIDKYKKEVELWKKQNSNK